MKRVKHWKKTLLVTDNDAVHWCSTLMLLCILMLYIDAVQYIYPYSTLMLYVDAIYWCCIVMLYIDAVYWCSTLMMYIFAVHWFSTSLLLCTLMQCIDAVHWSCILMMLYIDDCSSTLMLQRQMYSMCALCDGNSWQPNQWYTKTTFSLTLKTYLTK